MIIIRHKVRDYGLWRPIFNDHAEMQKAAGLTNPRVYHSADSNKSEIVVVFDTEDTKRAKAFATSTDLEETMARPALLIHRQSISLNQLIKRSDSLSRRPVISDNQSFQKQFNRGRPAALLLFRLSKRTMSAWGHSATSVRRS